MEDYFKISFASFMAFAISSLLSYLVLPYNDALASVIAWGAFIMLVIATFAFAVAVYGFVFKTSAHQQRKEYSDDCREQNRIEMFEIVSTDVETSKLYYVDGVKELIDSYIAEPLFAGFDDAVMNYLPESFHNPNYLNVDETVYGNYKVLKGLC